jgi:chaperonin cofactor prefoldin
MEVSDTFEKIHAEITGLRQSLDSLPGRLTTLVGELERFSAPAAVAEPIGETSAIPGDTAEIQNARAQLERLQDDTVVARQEYEEMIDQQREIDAKILDAKIEHDSLGSRLTTLHTEVSALETKRMQLNEGIREAEAILVRAEALREDARLIDSKREELRAMEQQTAAARRDGDGAKQLLQRLWPAWLLDGNLAPWRSELEAKAFDPASPPSFGLLFAALHGYNAALRDPDVKSLYDNLRDVGKRLYPWLKDIGKPEGEAAAIAEKWSEVINAECGGKAFVQVAIPGNPANNKWMIFTPTGGSAPDVSTVRSWCVMDSQKRPIHRAEILV